MNGHRLPSPSGARLSGDDFQHLITWIEVLRLLAEDGVLTVAFEVGQAEAGIADDLIVRREGDRPDRYTQVKFAVDDTTALTQEWFTTPPRDGASSPLQRFYETYKDLTQGASPPELQLITNRRIANGDPILEHRSGLDGKLVPRLFAATGAETRRARGEWAAHLEIEEDRLAEFLSSLVITTSHGTIDELADRARGAMALAGLRGDEAAVAVAVAIVRRMIEEGTREVDRGVLEGLIDASELAAAPAYATLVIEEIDTVPWAELAIAHVNWIELFEGESANERRRTRDPDAWNSIMRPDLREAIEGLRRSGASAELVKVEGAYRLPSAFLLGYELNERTGAVLAAPFAGGEWRTDEPVEPVEVEVEETEVGDHRDLAVAVSISADIGEHVLRYLNEEATSVGKLINIKPPGGDSRHSVSGAGHGRGLAEAIVDVVRRQGDGADQIHLFLASPNPMAMQLGRVWNRVAPTTVYADLSPGYAPTYLVQT